MATLFPNQTNANATTLVAGIGGGSNSPQTSQFSTISVSSINVNPQGYIEMFNNNANEGGQIIGYADTNNASSINILVSFVANYNDKINGASGLWAVEADANGANQRYGDFGAGRFVILGNNSSLAKKPPVLDSASSDGNLQINSVSSILMSTVSGVVIPTTLEVSSITVSSINGDAPSFPKMNWGATNIPASGSTIANIADNPYSGPYYQQLTYRGNVQAGLSSLFASSINGESFFIYGEPGQQVMFHTIGSA